MARPRHHRLQGKLTVAILLPIALFCFTMACAVEPTTFPTNQDNGPETPYIGEGEGEGEGEPTDAGVEDVPIVLDDVGTQTADTTTPDLPPEQDVPSGEGGCECSPEGGWSGDGNNSLGPNFENTSCESTCATYAATCSADKYVECLDACRLGSGEACVIGECDAAPCGWDPCADRCELLAQVCGIDAGGCADACRQGISAVAGTATTPFFAGCASMLATAAAEADATISCAWLEETCQAPSTACESLCNTRLRSCPDTASIMERDLIPCQLDCFAIEFGAGSEEIQCRTLGIRNEDAGACWNALLPSYDCLETQ